MLSSLTNCQIISKHDQVNQHSHSSLLSVKKTLDKSSAKFNAYKWNVYTKEMLNDWMLLMWSNKTV